MSTTLDVPFDTDAEEGSKFDLLPAGKYTAEIFDATVGPIASRRGQAISLTWQITEGDYARRLVFQSILIQHESEQAQRIGRANFKDVTAACGVTGSITDLSVLLFKPCIISVGIQKDKNGVYSDRNKVVRVYPDALRASPAQLEQAKQFEALREASKTQPAFTATGEKMDDEIPF
jgi:hypothetical protein